MHLSKSTDSHIYATVNPQKRPLDIISSLRAKMWVLSEFCPTLVFLPVLFNPMSGKVWDDIIRQEWVNLTTSVLGYINSKIKLVVVISWFQLCIVMFIMPQKVKSVPNEVNF